MSVKKFKFVSPGIFLSEVDNSQLPAIKQAVGPVIIGRTRMGPSMRPVKVESPSEFIQVFGNPVPGGGSGGDVWRAGNLTGPTYAAYAAMAYLKANVGPITMVRLLGEENPEAADTTTALAGWKCEGTFSTASSANGGAYGLFVVPSASAGSAVTGTLGAILYCNQGALALSGTAVSSSSPAGITHEGACALFENVGSDAAFRLSVYGPDDSEPFKTTFNFNSDSNLFIRNVLNTNPQLTNDDFVDPDTLKSKEQYYWLGESYETDITELLADSADTRAILIPMGSGTVAQKDEYKMNFQYAKTGYFFSQDLTLNDSAYRTENMVRLFRVVALDGGRWTQDNLKISINSIKASTNTADPYGSFNLVVRSASDRDNVVRIVEQFTNLNLNPASENYIGRVVGDTYYEFNYSQKVLRQYGQFVNKSKYIRMDMNPDIESGLMDARLLPFGCTGPLRFKTVEGDPADTTFAGIDIEGASSFLLGSGSVPLCDPPTGTVAANSIYVGSGSTVIGGLKLNFPEQLLRLSASDGGIADPEDAYFGPMATKTRASSRIDKGWGDYMWRKPEDVTQEDTITGIPAASLVEYSWAVSLDDVITSGSATAYWQSGSRQAGNSTTAKSSSWGAILDAGYDRITAPMYGGFDGLDITEAEPFRNGLLGVDGNLDTANYAFNSIKRAIDTVKDPEFVECNILSIPGVTNASLTQHLVDTCEDRADALAIIDLPEVYTPFTDSDETFQRKKFIYDQ
jgi:hypothetical protein